MSDTTHESTPLDSLLERSALAAMRAELGLLTPKQRSEAEQLLKGNDEQFDGMRLVEICLEGRAADDQRVAQRSLLALRSRFVDSGGDAARPRRRRSNLVVRAGASLTAKLIFSAIYTVVLVALLFVVNYHWPSINIYEFGQQVMLLLGLG